MLWFRRGDAFEVRFTHFVRDTMTTIRTGHNDVAHTRERIASLSPLLCRFTSCVQSHHARILPRVCTV
jgi:hypothetical protein